MPDPGDLGSLKSQDWQNLEELADSLENAWKKGESVDLTRFLPPAGTKNRLSFLQELIKTDLECRWRNGQAVGLDYYLEKFPEDLGSSQALPPALVFEEYRIRQLIGDKPPLQQYKGRFPKQFAEVEKLAEKLNLGSLPTAMPSGPNQPTPVTSEGGATPFVKNIVLAQTGGYTLVERIGTGGFAEVWKAKAPGGVLKAIKIIIRPIDQAEAQREVEAMELIKNLRHHFLLPIHAFWALDDRLMILMDLADGSLRDRLNQCKKEGKDAIPLPELTTYFHQAAEALDYLHSKKVQHRDIKPENILLAEGNVRVADFGLAKAQGTMRLATGTFAGTPHYMPPEVWNDKTHPHGDQYSLAVTYFELRVGRRLHKASGLPALMRSILHEVPELDPLDADAQKVLLKALAKNPEERFPSCLAFVNALAKADPLPESPTSDSPVSEDLEESLGTIHTGRGAKPTWRQPDTLPQISALPTPSPAPGHFKLRWLLNAAALLAVGALLAWPLAKPYVLPAKIILDAPAPLKIHAGETGTFQVHFQRQNFTGPVQVKVMRDLDILAEETIPANDTSVSVKVPLPEDAAPGRRQIRIEASAGDSRDEQVLELTMAPLRTLPEPSPAGVFRPMVGTTIWFPQNSTNARRHYYQHIECMAGDMAVHFVLIPYFGENKELFPFYIMVDKVCNKLFVKFQRDQSPDQGNKGGDLPKLGVEYATAYEFAQWLGGRLGELPLTIQWDTAAGRWEEGSKGDGPFLGNEDFVKSAKDSMRFSVTGTSVVGLAGLTLGQGPFLAASEHVSGMSATVAFPIAVGRKEPLPIGKAWLDRTWSGCRDMAGNGLEWTRNYKVITDLESKKIIGNGAHLPPLARAVLRGRDFHERDPLLWEDLDSPDDIPFHLANREKFHEGRLATIGFRVVIELRGD